MDHDHDSNNARDQRPDPDALLQQLHRSEARARRGSLKIFFGACAGVGKTCAMLSAARVAHEQGTAVVIGVVETHGRAETEALAHGLPRLPLRQVTHHDRALTEFDLDAALAFGAAHTGALVLLDELAHSNVSGSRHTKRWQDADEMLAAGIDVWSTVNVQHLDSLNDVVASITGVRVSETVPDRVFDQADEVVVVDLPPDDLLARLRAGKVYLPEQAQRASEHFFRKGNLLALRELALRRTADRIDGEMRAFRRAHASRPVWANRDAVLVGIGADDQADKLVRTGARMASQLDVPWHVVHVETPAEQRQSDAERDRVMQALQLAQEMGATTATVSAPNTVRALVRYARDYNLSRVVLGRRVRAPWPWPWHRPLADRLAQAADDLDVVQVALAQRPKPLARAQAALSSPRDSVAWRGYLWAVLACAVTALLVTPLLHFLELSNIVMLFLLAVVGVGLLVGRGPAVLAAFLGVGLFDFFFVPPYFSFAVSDVQYLITFAVMLVVALVVGQLTAGLQVQARAANERERRVRSLYDMARDLSAALLGEQVAEIGARFLRAEFGAQSALWLADDGGSLQPMHGGTAQVDATAAQWCYVHGQAAGLGTDTLPGSQSLVLPLKAPMRIRGVLAFQPDNTRPLSPEQRRLLETCASLLAISLERIHYIGVAQSTTVQIETERLRNSLLSAISHDLRTPLAAMVGLADTLCLAQPPLAAHHVEVAGAIKTSAFRMNAMVNNVLDMARLQAGAVRLNLAWQPLEEVVGTALAASAGVLAHRTIQTDLPDNLPLLRFDAVLMERVFVNLLENATRYTPPAGAIRLSAGVSGGFAEIALEDEGPGLPVGSESRLFDKFERGASRESAAPGVGLGLAICKAIVKAHGGTMRAANRHHNGAVVGACFTIALPLGTPPTDLGNDVGDDHEPEHPPHPDR